MAVNRSLAVKVAATLGLRKKEVARALPDSRGSETPKHLQQSRTEVYSYFTVPSKESQLLYSAESWVKIRLTLETAGPVSVGTSTRITPVLSGHGRLLDTDREYETVLDKGTRFYIASETVNRVSVTIEPIPWLGQIDEDNNEGNRFVGGRIDQAAQSIIAALSQLAGAFVPRSSKGQSIDDMVCPPQRGVVLPRALTPGAVSRKIR